MLRLQKKALHSSGFQSYSNENHDYLSSTKCCCDCRIVELDELDLKSLIDYLKAPREIPALQQSIPFWIKEKKVQYEDLILNALQEYQERLRRLQCIKYQSNKAPPVPLRKNGFELLSSFLASKQVPIMIRYGKLLDRQYGFPDVLARILWRQLSQNGASDDFLAPEFCYLVNKAVDELVGDGELRKLLLVVSAYCPHLWKYMLDDSGDNVDFYVGEKTCEGALSNFCMKQQLTSICRSQSNILLEDLDNVLDAGQYSLENELLLLIDRVGHREAEVATSRALKHVLIGDNSLWMLHGQNWITNMSISTAKSLRRAFKKRNAPASVTVLDTVERLLQESEVSLEFINLTIEHIASFKKEICKKKSSNTCIQDVNYEFSAQSFKKTLGLALREQATQLLESWTCVTVQTAIQTCETQNSFKNKPWKRNTPSLEQYVQLCLKLANKTRNPQLFALIIREKVTGGPFCAEALAQVLSEILVSLKIDSGNRFGVRIDSHVKSLTHHTSDSRDPSNVIAVKAIKLSNGTCRFTNPRNAKSFDCLFECVIDGIRERYPEIHERELFVPYLRERAASLVENDSLTWNGIRNRWTRLN